MTLVKWTPVNDPFDEFEKMMTEWSGFSQGRAFIPAMDIYQDKDSVFMEAPLPGIDVKNVKISIDNDVLTIEGSKEQKTEIDEKEYYRKEIKQGSFHRSVALPASVNGDRAEAEYENGILKVKIPKEQKSSPKQIEIKAK